MKAAAVALIARVVLLGLGGLGQYAQGEVIIDAIVTGKGGIARDLASKDFSVSIDGQEQAVTSAALPQRPNKRFLVLLFDSSTLNAADQTRIRQQVEKFIDTAASSERYMAVLKLVVGLEVIQPFTTDAARLKKSMERLGAGAATGAGSQGMLESGYNSQSTGRTTGLEQDSLLGLGSIAKTQNLMQWLAALGDSLAPIRGRKDVLFITGGGYALPTSAEVDNFVNAAMLACNRGNVALHGVSNDSSFAYLLGDRTGGSSVKISGSLAGSLEKVAKEQDANYLVAFSPPGALAQGCHQVRLKVPKGFDVRARREYCAGNQADPLAGTAVGKDLEAHAAGSTGGNMAVAMRIPFFYTAANRARAHVALEIVPEGVKFTREKGAFVGELNVVGVTAKSDGSAGPRFSEVVKFRFDKQEQVDAFFKVPFQYESQLEMPAGRYTFRVAVGSGEAFGKVSLPVEIEPWDPSRLAMGALAIGRIRRGTGAGLTAGLEPGLLEGATPLVASGLQVAPIGTARFPVTGAAAVYTEINAPAAISGAPEVTLHVRYVDLLTEFIKLDSGEVSAARYARAGSPVIPVAFDLPLKQLAPGSYQVQIRVSAGPTSTIRTADFEVY